MNLRASTNIPNNPKKTPPANKKSQEITQNTVRLNEYTISLFLDTGARFLRGGKVLSNNNVDAKVIAGLKEVIMTKTSVLS
jgi:hypothetical protein